MTKEEFAKKYKIPIIKEGEFEIAKLSPQSLCVLLEISYIYLNSHVSRSRQQHVAFYEKVKGVNVRFHSGLYYDLRRLSNLTIDKTLNEKDEEEIENAR